ncbi:DegV family protein [Alloiococcus sp. CFN-8]|uniref:DegV family protein n=1 Tax=Alloiococcus sp. CFN-8 TaxID=3416081 RepID=UPI003CE69548
MNRYVIIAETGSDIPKALADKYGIYLVPMHVTFDDVMKDDGSFPPEEVCSYYERTGQIPKTSGCNPEDFNKVFDEINEKHPDSYIIYMAYSAVTTCSYQSAVIASEGREGISFIDTKNVSFGQCAVVIRLAQEIEKHPEWTVKEVVDAANEIISSVSMCFTPYNLDYLSAGGRVSNASALCGNLLSIHPKIQLIDGYLKATKKYRGKMKKVVLNLIYDFTEEKNLDRQEVWMGSSIGFSDELKEEAINAAYGLGFQKVNWISAGGVITTHGGPKAFGIAGFTSEV